SGGRVLFLDKQTRQSLIKEIIQTTVIHSQNEFLRELKKREINVAQATISRDLWELKVAKALDESGEMRLTIFEQFTSLE
ncbi:arginine repressor, partial [Enterococcus faecalis]